MNKYCRFEVGRNPKGKGKHSREKNSMTQVGRAEGFSKRIITVAGGLEGQVYLTATTQSQGLPLRACCYTLNLLKANRPVHIHHIMSHRPNKPFLLLPVSTQNFSWCPFPALHQERVLFPPFAQPPSQRSLLKSSRVVAPTPSRDSDWFLP